jgi:hypothetical protein
MALWGSGRRSASRRDTRDGDQRGTHGLGDGCDEERQSFIKFSEKSPIFHKFEVEDEADDDEGSANKRHGSKDEDIVVCTPFRLALVVIGLFSAMTVTARLVSKDVIKKSADSIFSSKSNTMRYSTLPYYYQTALYEIFKFQYKLNVRVVVSCSASTLFFFL